MLMMAIGYFSEVEILAIGLFAVYFKFICQMAPTFIVQKVLEFDGIWLV